VIASLNGNKKGSRLYTGPTRVAMTGTKITNESTYNGWVSTSLWIMSEEYHQNCSFVTKETGNPVPDMGRYGGAI
jgi:hypothetical protein